MRGRVFAAREHVFDGERCKECGVNIYDCRAHGPEFCDREPITYTTTTTPKDAS